MCRKSFLRVVVGLTVVLCVGLGMAVTNGTKEVIVQPGEEVEKGLGGQKELVLTPGPPVDKQPEERGGEKPIVILGEEVPKTPVGRRTRAVRIVESEKHPPTPRTEIGGQKEGEVRAGEPVEKGGPGSSAERAVFVWDIYLRNPSDLDGDGFYDCFWLEIDADESTGGYADIYAVIRDDAGHVWTTPVWTIHAWDTADNYWVPFYRRDFFVQDEGNINLTVDIFLADGTYCDSETVGPIPVEPRLFIWDAWIVDWVDVDEDGCWEGFWVEIDADVYGANQEGVCAAFWFSTTDGWYCGGCWDITDSWTSDNAVIYVSATDLGVQDCVCGDVLVVLYPALAGCGEDCPADWLALEGVCLEGGCSLPYLWSIYLANTVDTDGDGFYEAFDLVVDADLDGGDECCDDVYVEIWPDCVDWYWWTDCWTVCDWWTSDNAYIPFEGWEFFYEGESGEKICGLWVDLYRCSDGMWLDTLYIEVPVDSCSAPYLFDVYLDNVVDQDGDGYLESFDLVIDADLDGGDECCDDVYVEIWPDCVDWYWWTDCWTVCDWWTSDNAYIPFEGWEFFYDGEDQHKTCVLTVNLYRCDGTFLDSLPIEVTVEKPDCEPYIFDLYVSDPVDVNGCPGYYEAFWLEIDADVTSETCCKDVFVVISDDRGHSWITDCWTICDWEVVDNAFVYFEGCEVLSPGECAEVVFTVDLYDCATETLVDSQQITVPLECPTTTVTIYPTDASTGLCNETYTEITIDSLPTGLSGYQIIVCLTGGCAEIVDVEPVAFNGAFQVSPLPSDCATFSAADLADDVPPGAQDVVLARVWFHCIEPCDGEIHVTVNLMDDDFGAPIPVHEEIGMYTCGCCPDCVVDDLYGPPTDPDGDGLCEDVNGNGRMDFDDAVRLVYAYASQDPCVMGNVECFDCNGNGRIDFDDAVCLVHEIVGGHLPSSLAPFVYPVSQAGGIEQPQLFRIVLEEAPTGLAGFILTLEAEGATEIEEIDLGVVDGGAIIQISPDGRRATVAAADLQQVVGVGARRVELARMRCSGVGQLILEVEEMDDDRGAGIELPRVKIEPVTSTSALQIYSLTISGSPVRNTGLLRFSASGVGIAAVKLDVYSSAGELVYSSGFVPGTEVEWNLCDLDDNVVPNGVYLYVLTFQGVDGSIVHIGVQKLAVLR